MNTPHLAGNKIKKCKTTQENRSTTEKRFNRAKRLIHFLRPHLLLFYHFKNELNSTVQLLIRLVVFENIFSAGLYSIGTYYMSHKGLKSSRDHQLSSNFVCSIRINSRAEKVCKKLRGLIES